MAAANGTRFTPALPPRSSSLARSWTHLRHVGIGGAAVGRVVLEAAVLGRIVRRRDDDAVGEVLLAAAVVDEDGSRDDRRRRDAVVALDDGLHAVGRQDLQRRALGRRRTARACPCPCRAGRPCPGCAGNRRWPG